jgi:D-erythronate 2-dehydrogenase
MHVVVTGGAGFLGTRLARALLARGALAGPDGRPRALERLTLLDAAPARGFDDGRVEVRVGDVADPDVLAAAVPSDVASIFHLAAVVSAQAEAELDLGLRVNVDATRALLERARRNGNRPRLVFASSVAVFGGALPPRVPDGAAVAPQSSYGAQKAIGELLVADYRRRGLVDGRALRLPTVAVRPGAPNRAASSFASAIVREPLAGKEAICPVAPETRMWLTSPRRAVQALLRAHDLPAEAFAAAGAVNLPGLSVTVAEMVAALGRVAGEEVAARVRFEPDAAIARIVASWPGDFAAERALALGFEADASFEEIVRAYLEDDVAPPPG